MLGNNATKLKNTPENAHVVTFHSPFDLSDTLNIIADNVMETGYEPEEITGVALEIEDAEITKVWITNHKKPHAMECPYIPII